MTSLPDFARASCNAYSNELSVLAMDKFKLLTAWSATTPTTLRADCKYNRLISLDSIITCIPARNVCRSDAQPRYHRSETTGFLVSAFSRVSPDVTASRRVQGRCARSSRTTWSVNIKIRESFICLEISARAATSGSPGYLPICKRPARQNNF
jgi:hypothetical protein